MRCPPTWVTGTDPKENVQQEGRKAEDLQNPSSLLLGRDISIVCFQETSVEGVCYQVTQRTLAKPGHP